MPTSEEARCVVGEVTDALLDCVGLSRECLLDIDVLTALLILEYSLFPVFGFFFQRLFYFLFFIVQ